MSDGVENSLPDAALPIESGFLSSWTWELDHDALISAGGYLQKLNMYPYFDIAHYLLSCMLVRDDMGPLAVPFSRRHPFSCWLSSMLISFAGGFLSSFLLGEPPIAAFKNHRDILMASIVWYCVFYSPLDIVYKLIKFYPVKIPLSVMKEVQRTYKIGHGVSYAAKLYPESYLVQVLVGTSKGAGSGVVKIIEQLVRGAWLPTGHELLKPSFTTKACVIASCVFVLERQSMYVTAPHDLVYLCIVGFFVYFKLSALVLGVADALAPLENLVCSIFMGGIFDALYRAYDVTKEELNGGQKKPDDVLMEDIEKDKQRKPKKNDKKNK